MAVIISKNQEFEALKKIMDIINELGDDSYIGTAFEGCIEIAQSNIKYDQACSMKALWKSTQNNAVYYAKLAETRSKELEEAKKEIDCLRKKLELEQEWKDYDIGNFSQSYYDDLIKQPETHYLTDEEAKDLLYDWYGFAKEKITIHKSIPIYQINRHRQLRQTGTVDRRPAYFSTDWNYIRFDCGGTSYELCNDNLNFFLG